MTTKKIKRIALIDGDTVAYSAGFSSQKKTYAVYPKPMGDESPSLNEEDKIEEFGTSKEADKFIGEDTSLIKVPSISVSEERAAIGITKRLLNKINDQVNATETKVFLSDNSTFRHIVATSRPYKGNRDRAHKPYHLELIKGYLRNVKGAEVWDDLEADDAISISSYRHDADGDLPFIVSIDKDLDQIPGHHYNFRTDTLYFVSPRQALRNYYIQVLTGDMTDNIQGLQGVGPNRAEKILGKEHESNKLAYIVYQEYVRRLGKDEGLKRLEEVCKLVYLLKNEQEKNEAIETILPK